MVGDLAENEGHVLVVHRDLFQTSGHLARSNVHREVGGCELDTTGRSPIIALDLLALVQIDGDPSTLDGDPLLQADVDLLQDSGHS